MIVFWLRVRFTVSRRDVVLETKSLGERARLKVVISPYAEVLDEGEGEREEEPTCDISY